MRLGYPFSQEALQPKEFQNNEVIKMTKSICFFNHKGGVSKTTTTFNLGWALAQKGHRVLMVDLDSQCNLTGLVMGHQAIDDEKMESFYANRNNLTLQPIINAVIEGMQPILFMGTDQGKVMGTRHENLFLLPGYLNITDLDAQISMSLKIARSVPVMRNIPGYLTSILQIIAMRESADYILYDLSPNVGGVNEVILMSSNYFIVPTSPDYFCLQAVGSLTKHLVKWHNEIEIFKKENDFISLDFPIKNAPKFIGTIQQRYRPRCDKPATSFQVWIDKIRQEIVSNMVPSLTGIGCSIDASLFKTVLAGTTLEPFDLAHVPDFNSLIAISQQHSKPIFDLTDQEIKETGRVFGHAEATMLESRDKFNEVFTSLSERVIALTK
jgi:cellulose biosynthesis protein BcsQ